MFTQQLTDQMSQFIDDLKLDRRRKQAASSKGRAINCMELEDRILLSATPITPEALANKTTGDVQQAATQSAHSVASDPAGNHVIVWSSLNQDGSGWGVYAQRFNAAGVAQGNEFQVNTHTTNDQKDPRIAMSDNGSFIITWTDGNGEANGSADVYARRFDANGNPLQDHDFLVNSTTDRDQKFASVGMNNNLSYITWTSQNESGTWDLFGQRFDVNGNLIGGEFKLNSTSSENAIVSQVGVDNWGYVGVVWQSQNGSNSDIHTAYLTSDNGVYSNNGNPIITADTVVNSTSGNCRNPNMGFNPNVGNYVLSWTTDNGNGTSDIYARQYDLWGNAVGSEFCVNSTSAGNMDNSSVAVDINNGSFIVTWSSFNQDEAGGWGVYSRSYNADGTPNTDEVRINYSTAGSQNYSSAAFLGIDSYVITWSGEGIGDDAGVFSTVFKPTDVSHTGLFGQYSNDLNAGNPNLSGSDIGWPSQNGSTNFDGRTWTINGGGAGFGSTSDQFQFASEDFADNGYLLAKIDSISGSNGTAGLMFRNNANPDSAFAGVFQQGNNVSFQWRDGDGLHSTNVSLNNANSPVWLSLNRSGNMFSGYYSFDNINWIQIGDAHSVTMNSIVKAGLAVTSGDDGSICTSAFSNVAVVNPRNFVLAGMEIGSPGQPGSTSYANGVYSISGGGTGIGGTADKFQFGANGLVGDWDLSAQITSVDAGATAGVMLRNDYSAGSMFAGVIVGPDHVLNFEWRNSVDGSMQSVSGPSVTGPVWGKVTRSGSNFQGWYSTNGTDWNQIGTTQTIVMGETVFGGLAVTSNNDGLLGNATFSNLATSRSVAFNGTGTDIGGPGKAGSSLHVNDAYVVTAGGALDWDVEQFHFTSQDHSGDGEIVAQVVSLNDVSYWTEAGVMFRDGNSTYIAIGEDTENQGVYMHWRDSNGSFDYRNCWEVGDAPAWVKLVREGNTFTGYASKDGSNWIRVGGDDFSVTLDMNTDARVGLSVTAGDDENNPVQTTAVFTHVSIDQSTALNFTDEDISYNMNPPALSGSSYFMADGYVVNGGGSDIWSGSDQFQFDSQQAAGDLSMIATINSIGYTGYCSKGGLMFREDLNADSMHVMLYMNPEHRIVMQTRGGDGAATSDIYSDYIPEGSVTLKLIRSGNEFSGFYSNDGGTTWTQVGNTQTVAMNENIQVGLAVTAWNNNTVNTATFSNVSLTESRQGGDAGNTDVAFQRIVSGVDFNWGEAGSPGTGISGTNWSASWQGKVLADYTGDYTFRIGGDDGVRLWINGQQLINGWNYQGFTTYDGTIHLEAGQWYSIRMDYFQGGGGDRALLQWSPPGQSLAVIPANHLSFDNEAPVNQVPAAQIAITNTPLVFSSGQFRITDTDACYGPMEVTLALTPGTGTLTLSRTNGLTFSSGTGVGDATMTFIGSIDDINAALNGLQYTPGADFTGQSSLSITTNDMAPAFTGGSKSDTDTVAITVASAKGFLATYYANSDFTGTSVQTVDPTINFNWNGASPAQGITGSNWSVRWTGWLEAPETGSYTFHAASDSGCRVWINNQLVIDPSAAGGLSSPIILTAGQSYLVRMEYAPSGLGGQVNLEWSKDGSAQEVISSDQVDHVNRAMVNTIHDNQSVRENSPLVFSTANGNAITVSDSVIEGVQTSVSVIDGSFESPNLAGMGQIQVNNPTGSAWTFQGSSGLTTNAGLLSESNVKVNDGAQAAFIQCNGSISQDVTFAESGNYTISFMAAYRQYGGTSPITVKIDGVVVGTFTPDGLDFNGYQTESIAVTAGTHQVTFSHRSDNDQVVFIDRVSIVKSETLVRVTLAADSGLGTLSIGNKNGLTFTTGDGTNDQTMTFIGTLADVNAALDGLQYLPTSNVSGAAHVQVTTSNVFSALPGALQSTTSQISVNVLDLSNISDYSGLLTTYYNWDSTAGSVYRIDPTINFTWNENGSPAPGIVGNNWNASWQGKITADHTGTYTFYATADDGVRLWVNGALLVDAANGQALNTMTGTIDLVAGQSYSIRMEYYQHNAGGNVKLEWSCGNLLNREVIPSGNLNCGDLLSQNTAPVNNLSSQQTANYNTPIVFSSANGNAISVSDPSINQATASVAVGDGNFETPNLGTGWFANQYNPSGSAWTFEGSSGLAANGSGMSFESGNAPSGTQVAFLQFNSTISQNIDFAAAGNYTISFEAAYRVNGGASPFSVFVDGVNVGTYTPGSAAFQGYQTNSFAVTAGSHRVTFSHSSSTDQTVFIDRVTIAKTDSLVQVNLAVDSGALTLANTNGLIFLSGDGRNDASMTISGTLADINAALEGLQFMPAADYTGTMYLHVTSTRPGTILTGGPKSASGDVKIDVSQPSASAGLLGLFYQDPNGAAVNYTNLAYGKNCTASTAPWAGWEPFQVVDGNPDTANHTVNGYEGNGNQWLQVDLGANTDLTQIRLVNRNVCGDRLQYFTISVLDHNGNVVWSQTDDSPTYDAQVLTFNTGDISGQYILIQKNDANYLHLAEVQAFNLSIPEPDISRIDPTVNFAWGNAGSPAPGVDGNQWTACWQGLIQAQYSETYTFHLTADDAVRLWVNDQLLVDSWHAQDSTTHTGTIVLEAGQQYSIHMEYRQFSGDSGVKLEWSSASQTREVIPASQLSHVNQAPVNVVPGQQTTNDDTPVVFSTANGNAIQVSDADALYGPLKVTLTVDRGTLTLNSPNNHNLTFLSGDGLNDSTIMFIGKLSDINKALDGLTYTPVNHNDGGFAPSVNLQITTDDQAPALAGGSLTCTSTVPITVTIPMEYNGLLGTYTKNWDYTPTDFTGIGDVIGSPAIAGSNTFANGVYTVTAAGTDIGGSSDQGQFVSETATGDVSLIARVDLSADGFYSGKAGIMFRDSNDPGAMNAMIEVSPDGHIVYQWRNGTGQWFNWVAADTTVSGSVWLKLSREGNDFTGFYSTDGSTWTQVGSRQTILMGVTVQAGLAVSSMDQNNTTTATFDNVSYAQDATAQRVDPSINFNWGNENSPITGVAGTNWTARWLGTITADYSEAYTFSVTADDGVRLWVNDRLIIDQWHAAGGTAYTGTIDMVAGQAYSFRMEYKQITGGESVKLEWSSASQTAGVITSDHFHIAEQTPINVVPTQQNGIGNQPIVFSEANGNAISIAELDNNGNPVTVTISTTKGTLTLNGSSGLDFPGLTFSAGTGFNDATMTFTGSIADINAALNGLCYTRANGDSGSATLQITSTDQNTPTGARSSTNSIQIGAVQTLQPGLLATFYSDTVLGTPVTSRIDPTIDFTWAANWDQSVSPAPGVNSDYWSAKWEGVIQVQTTETYTFTATADDGVRLWVNGQLLINQWNAQTTSTFSGSINLVAGQSYSIRMEYFQANGPDCAKLEWSTPTIARETIPNSQLSHATQSPAVYLPKLQSANEGTSLTFSVGNGNAISVTNVDASSNQLQVTITAANGTFSLGGNSGLASTTLTGSLEEINTALSGLSFTPTSGFVGAAGLRIGVTDLVTSATVDNALTINVLAVNKAPVNNVPGSQAVPEHATLVFSQANDNAISVGDPDINPATSSVAVGDSSFEAIQLSAGNASYQYAVYGSDWSFSGQSGIAGNGSPFNNANAPSDSQVAFLQNSGAISQDINFAEAGNYVIGFEAAYRPYYNGTNPISVEVDGVSIGVINPASTDFKAYRTSSFAVTAGTHRVTFRGMSTNGDKTSFIDRVTIDKASSLIQVSLAVDIGKLNLASTNGLIFSQGSGNNASVMTFTGTQMDVNAALAGMQYVPLASYNGSDTLRITTNDLGNTGVGGPISTSSSVLINTVPVNDPPVNTVPGTQGTYINRPIVFNDANRNAISIADQDVNEATAFMTVDNNGFESPAIGNGEINISPSGYNWTFNSQGWMNDMWNFSGIAAVGGNQAPSTPDGGQMAFIQGRASISQDITFTESGDYTISFLSAYRSFCSESSSNPIMVQVDGQNVGVITPNSTALQSYETNAFSVTAGIHTVTFTGLNPQGGDQASFVDNVKVALTPFANTQVQVNLAVNHGTLTLSGTHGLTFAEGSNNGAASMTLTGTLADINAALDGLVYSPANGYVGSDSIRITTNDLGVSDASNPRITVNTIDVNISGGAVVNVTTDGTQQTFPQSPQAVAADANGNYVVVWSSENQDGNNTGWDVYYRQFNAAGVPQGNEFRANTHTSGDQMYATVAMNADGGFVVTWSTNSQDGSGWSVYGQKFDASGNAVGSEFQINTTTASDQMYSSVTINDNGDFAVTWSNRNQNNGTWDVFARVFYANGQQSQEIQVNDINRSGLGDQMYSRIAMDSTGAFTIAWQSRLPNGNWDIFARQFNADGSAKDSEFRVNDTIAGDQQNANIAMNEDGKFVISWTSDSPDGSGKNIYARQFNSDGSTDPVYTVSGCGSDIWATSDHFQYASQDVSNDATMVAYVDSVSNTGTFAKAGVMFRDSLDPDSMHAMIYVSPENRVVFQWRTTDGGWCNDTEHTNQSAGIIESRVWVKLTRVGNEFTGYYSTDGVSWIQVGSTQTIFMKQNNYKAGLEVSSWDANALCTATFKHVSINQSTDLQLVSGDIDPQTYAGSTTIGNEFRVNTTPVGDQDYSSVAIDETGNYFITWSSSGQNANGASGIYGRRFNADGTSTGAETRLNPTTDGSQAYSSVTSLSNKNFIVVWSGSAPGDTAGVFQAVQGPPGLLASYFDNSSFSGTPIQRIDPSINFNYGYRGAPIPGFNLDNWSVRWEGMIRTDTTDTFTFYVNEANSAKVWINGQLVIGSGNSGSISLVAGQLYNIRVDYCQSEGWKNAKLQWSSSTFGQQLIPSTQFTYENLAPVNTLPEAQRTNENTPMVFSTQNGNAIQVGDITVGYDTMEVTLAVNYGTLTLNNQNNNHHLTFFAGDGDGDATMTFRGSIDDINAALDGLQFTPTANYSGPVDLHITTNDLGGTGIGGAKITTSTLSLGVVPPPAIFVPGQQGVLEHQPLQFSLASGNAIRIGVPDAGNNPVQVALMLDKGVLALSGIQGLTFADGSGPTGSSMIFTGKVADINAALEGMQFVSAGIVYDNVAHLQIQVNDLGNTHSFGGPQSNAKSVAIGVTAVNDPPVISLPRYLGNDPTQIVFSNANGNPILVSDPEGTTNPITLTIQASEGTFNLGNTAGLSILGGVPSQSTYVMIYGSIDNINRALDGFVFKTPSFNAELQLIANDLSNSTGIGGSQQSAPTTLSARQVFDPNFKPDNSSARFQQISGVMTQPALMTAQDVLHNSQLQAKLPSLEHDQGNSSLFMTNAAQNANAQLGDAGANACGAERNVNRGKEKNSDETFDARDAKAIEDAKFSADTQDMNETVQTGTGLRRDENILVGLGMMSAGYLAWAFNGGSLLAGAISATPMWKPFDPLAVLDFNDRTAGSGIVPLDGEAGVIGEDNLQSLFG